MDGSALTGCSDGITPLYTPYVDWIGLFQYGQAVTQASGMVFVDYLCPGITVATEPASQVAWGVANFLLMRTGNSYYAAKDEATAVYTPYPSIFKPRWGPRRGRSSRSASPPSTAAALMSGLAGWCV